LAEGIRVPTDRLIAKVLDIAERVGGLNRAAVVRALQAQLTTTAVALAGAAAAGSAADALSHLALQAGLWGQAAAITGAALASGRRSWASWRLWRN